jgi:hypothetical protein
MVRLSNKQGSLTSRWADCPMETGQRDSCCVHCGQAIGSTAAVCHHVCGICVERFGCVDRWPQRLWPSDCVDCHQDSETVAASTGCGQAIVHCGCLGQCVCGERFGCVGHSDCGQVIGSTAAVWDEGVSGFSGPTAPGLTSAIVSCANHQ